MKLKLLVQRSICPSLLVTIAPSLAVCLFAAGCMGPANRSGVPTTTAGPSSGSFIIHNFMPDFWEFWAAAEGKSVEQAGSLWQSIYVAKHPGVFEDLAGPCKDEFDRSWADSHYFPDLPRIVPQMHEATDTLRQSIEVARANFVRMFPDMHWAGDVYVLASGYCFNGRAQIIQGREAILFGIDTRVSMGQKDLVPEMTHELFHRYHRQFFDFEPSKNYPLWTVLWAEGLAEYVEEQLNPNASEIDLSLVPAGMPHKVEERRGELAADFLNRFAATDTPDAKAWFNDIDSKDPVVPARAGYELGVLVVRELSKTYTIQTMAHWSRGEAEPKTREALRTIAGDRKSAGRL